MKIRHRLPDRTVLTERTMTFGRELHREEVFSDDDHPRYLGCVIYVRRQHGHGGSTYGWRPEKNPRTALLSKTDAILRLPRVHDELTVR